MANSKQKVYTQTETEAVEIAGNISEYLLDNYAEYPAKTILFALAIVATDITKHIEKEILRKKAKNETGN